METIPVIHLKKRNIYTSHLNNHIKEDELKQRLPATTKLYLYDHDGINKDKPNLCLLQRLTPYYDIWFDTGPRVLGDIVDAVMAGANTIIIRPPLYHNHDLTAIKETIEQPVFTTFNPQQPLTNFLDGIILTPDNNLDDFKTVSHLKNLATHHTIYLYTPTNQTISKQIPLTGHLIDLHNYKEKKNKP